MKSQRIFDKMPDLEMLAKTLGNVSVACQKLRISRSYYYKWIRHKRHDGEDDPDETRAHPQAVAVSTKDLIIHLAAEFPEWGSNRISFYLQLKKLYVSPTTVQKLLVRNGLGRREDRRRSAGLHPPTP